MDVIKQQLARIQDQVGKLSASQKMLTASLLAIMVLTFLFWGKYAGTPEMEPVLSQALSSDELLGIRDTLKGAGISYSVEGDRVMVPAEKRLEAIAVLSAADRLPADTSGGFQDIISKLNPLASPSTTDRMWVVAYQQLLQNVIRHYPGVKSATVVISAISERRVSSPSIEPSAAVSVTLKPGLKPDKKMANSIADLVSHSYATLNRDRVSVTINLQTFNMQNRNANGLASGSEIGEMEREAEELWRQRLESTLAGYGNIYASVRVSLDNETSRITANEITTVISKEKSIKSETSESTTPSNGSSEPGAVSNAPLSVDSGRPAVAGTAGSTTTEKNETTMDNMPSSKITETNKMAGKTEPTSASVQLSWSFFAGLLKAQAGASAKDPTDQEVRDYFEKQFHTKITDIVKKTTGIKEDTQVAVDLYNDQLTLLAAVGTDAAGGAGGSGSGGGIVGTIGGYTKEIAVGVLALMSLMMVSMMVKKSTPAPIVTASPALPEVEETITIDGSEAIAGEVAESDQALDGMELDDGAVKAQQMIDQVSTMVKENPDAAANLVKRWLNK